MLAVLFSLFFTLSTAQNLCGRDCLSPCRMLAIACVRGIDEQTPPINPGQLLTLMQCVINNKEKEEWKLKAPDCEECINAELEEITPEQKAECLGNRCEKIENQKNCDAAVKPLSCGWIGGVCHQMDKQLKNRAEFSGLIADLPKDECLAFGGKVKKGNKKGNKLCRRSNTKRLRCGQVNKLSRRHLKLNKCTEECMNVCRLLPNCQYKESKQKCASANKFIYAFGPEKKE